MIILQENTNNTVLTEQDLIDIYMEGYNEGIQSVEEKTMLSRHRIDLDKINKQPHLIHKFIRRNKDPFFQKNIHVVVKPKGDHPRHLNFVKAYQKVNRTGKNRPEFIHMQNPTNDRRKLSDTLYAGDRYAPYQDIYDNPNYATQSHPVHGKG